MNNKIAQLIDAVKNKTDQGLAEWKPTSSTTEFQLLFDNGKITTDYYRAQDESGDLLFVVEIRIYNNRGDEIFSQTATAAQNKDAFSKLKNFYDSVKSSYFKASETINALLEEAEGPGHLGDPAPF